MGKRESWTTADDETSSQSRVFYSFLVCTLSCPTFDQLAAAFKVLVVQKYLGTCLVDMIGEFDHNFSVIHACYVYISASWG